MILHPQRIIGPFVYIGYIGDLVFTPDLPFSSLPRRGRCGGP